MIVTLPIVLILLDYWPLGRLQQQQIGANMTNIVPVFANQERKKTKSKKGTLKKNISLPNYQKLSETKMAGIIPLWQLWEKIPFFVFSVVSSIITLYAPDAPPDPFGKYFSLSSRIANAPVSFITYLEKTFWPHDLAIFYPFSDQLPVWQILGATLLIIVISAAVIVTVKRLPCLFVGWLWYAITLLPVIGIIQISSCAPYAMADRYTYLPLIGISIMLAWGIPLLIKREEMRKIILFPAGVISIAILSFLTWQQCGYWKNSTTLFNHTLQVTSDNYEMHNTLGLTIFGEGKTEEAFSHYNEAIRISPDYIDAYNNRGVAYYKLGNYQQAIRDYNKVIELYPQYAMVYYNRGNAYYNLGDYQQAINDYNKAIELNPQLADAYSNRGVVYYDLGNIQRAMENFKIAARVGDKRAQDYLRSKGIEW